MSEASHSSQATTALMRDVHKGIRTGLSMVVTESGSIDPGDPEAIGELAEFVAAVVDLLDSHARAEDTVMAPVIRQHVPDLGAVIAQQHQEFADSSAELVSAADAVASASNPRAALLELHLDLSAFMGAYLLHQDFEERVVVPALVESMGLAKVRKLEIEMVAAVPEDERLDGLVMMIPAMNIQERVEVLSNIHDNTPSTWFDQVWEVVNEVLEPEEIEELASRIGLN